MYKKYVLGLSEAREAVEAVLSEAGKEAGRPVAYGHRRLWRARQIVGQRSGGLRGHENHAYEGRLERLLKAEGIATRRHRRKRPHPG